MCGNTRTKERYRVIDFSRHILQHGLTFLSSSPRKKSKLWFIVRSFTPVSWAVLATVFLVLLIALYGSFLKRNDLPLSNCLQVLVAIVLKQCKKMF